MPDVFDLNITQKKASEKAFRITSVLLKCFHFQSLIHGIKFLILTRVFLENFCLIRILQLILTTKGKIDLERV